MPERPTHTHQEAEIYFNSHHQRAEIGSFRYQLDSAEPARHPLHLRLPITGDALEFKAREFSALAPDYNCLTIGCRRRASDTTDNWKRCGGSASDNCGAFPFNKRWNEEHENHGLES